VAAQPFFDCFADLADRSMISVSSNDPNVDEIRSFKVAESVVANALMMRGIAGL
jgi:hypothetical protein